MSNKGVAGFGKFHMYVSKSTDIEAFDAHVRALGENPDELLKGLR